ncbi:hypothetical protein EVAR_56207_1 [Eumeta japonica]|uniref:Uncharacterized protein n=1 Tax=Eumeta variegata TaxID=151549 RepID=A0A4C1Y8H3_EUMVA|nr:hypothetical protein EVAR_56207_1 [Eumeta japonica]
MNTGRGCQRPSSSIRSAGWERWIKALPESEKEWVEFYFRQIARRQHSNPAPSGLKFATLKRTRAALRNRREPSTATFDGCSAAVAACGRFIVGVIKKKKEKCDIPCDLPESLRDGFVLGHERNDRWGFDLSQIKSLDLYLVENFEPQIPNAVITLLLRLRRPAPGERGGRYRDKRRYVIKEIFYLFKALEFPSISPPPTVHEAQMEFARGQHDLHPLESTFSTKASRDLGTFRRTPAP